MPMAAQGLYKHLLSCGDCPQPRMSLEIWTGALQGWRASTSEFMRSS